MVFLFLSAYYIGFATMNKIWFSRSRTQFERLKCPSISLRLLLGKNLEFLATALLLLNFGPHVLETVYTPFEPSVGV
jgi:hypothetical protein